MQHSKVEVAVHGRNTSLEMMRMLSATVALASGLSLGVGALIVALAVLLQ